MKAKFKVKYLIYFQIIYNCIIKFFITDYGLPSALNYVSDLILLIMLIAMYQNKRVFDKQKQKVTPLIFAILLFILTTVSFLIDFSTPWLYLWGIRNVYRFFVFFYCCIYFLNIDNIYKIFDILEKIFIINFIVCIYEYFVRGMRYDFLGGLFGNGVEGGNGPLNALLVIVTSYVIIEFLNKKKKLYEVSFIIIISLWIAAVAELKVFFFEIIIITLIVALIRREKKVFVLIFVMIFTGSFALKVYSELYPTKGAFLNMSFIEDYAANTTYGAATDINRLTAINIIDNDIFDKDLKKRFIGLGIGNAETSAYSFLNSRFYKLYGESIKYNWFSHAFAFVEYGYIGLLLYVLFFCGVIVGCLKKIRDIPLVQISFICTIMDLIFLVYNQTLRVETMGYTLFMIMSIPYICKKCESIKEESNK